MAMKTGAAKILLAAAVSSIMCVSAASFAGGWQSNRLVVYGDGFRFSVAPPKGWSVRTGNPPRNHLQAILMVWPRPRGTNVPLVILEAKIKTGKPAEKELSEIVEAYAKPRPEIKVNEIKDLPEGGIFWGRQVEAKGKHCEYLVFFEPGKEYRHWCVARMKVMGRTATDQEKKAFVEILGSIKYLGDLSLPATQTETGRQGPVK